MPKPHPRNRNDADPSTVSLDPATATSKDLINVVPDNRLHADVESMAITLLSVPSRNATPEENVAWATALLYNTPFGRTFSCDRVQHRCLDGRYIADPRWNALTVVNSLIVRGTRYNEGDFVMVRPSRSDEVWNDTVQWQEHGGNEKKKAVHAKNGWIAKIDKLRTNDRGEGWAMIAWLYWPQHLKSAWEKAKDDSKEAPSDGEKGYHGDFELVASNHLDIIDVNTFDRVFNADIEACTEAFGEEINEYYWRQTYDVRDGRLSDLPRYCKCAKFFKPDTHMIECPSCKKWLHQECILTSLLSQKWRDVALKEGHPLGRPKATPKDDRNYPLLDTERWNKRFQTRCGRKCHTLRITGLERREEGEEEVKVVCLIEGCKKDFIEASGRPSTR